MGQYGGLYQITWVDYRHPLKLVGSEKDLLFLWSKLANETLKVRDQSFVAN